MSKRGWIIFVVVVVVLLTGLVLISRSANPQIDTSKIDANAIQTASAANGNIADHVFGPTTSKVTLIEYGDFQCPYCGEAHPQLKAITTEYQNQVTFIFRNFPITTAHPNARAAAAAVESAGLQGKYWEMHNAVYENQSTWENLTGETLTNAFASLAGGIGVDKDKFIAGLSDPAVNQKISYDQAVAKKLGVEGTPSLYLNGKLLDTNVSQDLETGTGTKLKTMLNAALKAAHIALPAGES